MKPTGDARIEKVLRLFAETNGRPARSPEELDDWLRSGGFTVYDYGKDWEVWPLIEGAA